MYIYPLSHMLFMYIYIYTIPITLSQLSRVGTKVSFSLCVYVFVLFRSSVLGPGFLSSLPLRLT